MIKIIFSDDEYSRKGLLKEIRLLKRSARLKMTSAIICTTDFSESSKEALRWSIDMARKMGSHLTILHTYRLIKQNGEGAIPQKKKIEEDAMKNLTQLEKELLSNSGVEYDFKIEVGFVDDRIAEHVKSNQISFLVIDKGMGLRNKESFDDLVRDLQIPLVIVP
ncbi:MAG TPA: universal stress protein [Cyclobacteriaceae bacterium]|nr:universal stress protein [Cyclobacteriaceae bacterium]